MSVQRLWPTLRPVPHPLAALPDLAIDDDTIAAIRAGAWIVFNLSGGKDSSAAMFAVNLLLDLLGHPRERRIAIHADLGRAEWASTPATVAQLAAIAGVPLTVVRRAAGDLVDRWIQRFENGKARVMAELRAIVGSAWTRADQRNRQLWFALGGAAIGILAWAIVPGLVAREIAPASWQWPERMAARTLDLPRWEAGQRMMQSASPAAFGAIVAGDRIVTANRETIEGCQKAANKARETVPCTVKISPADGVTSRRSPVAR